MQWWIQKKLVEKLIFAGAWCPALSDERGPWLIEEARLWRAVEFFFIRGFRHLIMTFGECQWSINYGLWIRCKYVIYIATRVWTSFSKLIFARWFSSCVVDKAEHARDLWSHVNSFIGFCVIRNEMSMTTPEILWWWVVVKFKYV